MPGIEYDHNLVITLSSVLSRQQFDVASGRLPVDRPRIQTALKLAQRLELGTISNELLALQTREKLSIPEELQSKRTDASRVWDDGGRLTDWNPHGSPN